MSNSRTFFHGQITAEFPPCRNYGRDYQAERLEHELRKTLNRFDDNLLNRYSEVAEYTERMDFNWFSDVPEFYKSIETWYNMREAGKGKADCYLYYLNNVPNEVSVAFIQAMLDAFQPYQPPENRPDFALTEEELVDPNSPSVVS